MPTNPPTHRGTSQQRPVVRGEHDRTSAGYQIRHTNQWTTYSRHYRNRNPRCCDPLGHHTEDGRTVLTEQVHHIVPLEVDASRAYDDDNCAPVCCDCHRHIETMFKRGQETATLFNGWIARQM